ncbi:MAG: magnesium transporter CorA family protein [Bacteroidales bacterium]
MTSSKFYHFSPAGLHYSVDSVDKALAVLKEGGFIWLNFYSPERQELSRLVDTLGIHPLSIEDCMDASQVPKIEHFPGNSFIIFNAFTYTDKTLWIDELDMFIADNFVITVSGFRSDGRDPLKGIETLVEVEIENARKGPAFLAHIILDHIVDQKFHAIESVEDELEEAEGSLMDNPEKFDATELIRLRRYLLNLRKSLFHEREILVKICRLDSPFIGDKAIFHYRDIYDHLAKFLELTENYREIVTSLMELYTSLLNNIMTNASNQTNLSVRRLTLIATIFMPLTLLASIGGMSEWSMMTGPDNWKISYPLFLAGMIIIGILSFMLIRRLEKKK